MWEARSLHELQGGSHKLEISSCKGLGHPDCYIGSKKCNFRGFCKRFLKGWGKDYTYHIDQRVKHARPQLTFHKEELRFSVGNALRFSL